MSLSFKVKLLVGFVILLAILALFGWKQNRVIDKTVEDMQSVTHTHEVLVALNGIEAILLKIETGVRGYVLTSKETYLKPFYEGKDDLFKSISQLRELTLDNSFQKDNTDSLELLINLKVNHASNIIRLGQRNQFDSAVEMIRSGIGFQYMEKLHSRINVMQNEEERLLIKGRETASQTISTDAFLLIVPLVMLLGLSVLLFWSLQRYPSVMEKAKDELERLVYERTISLDALTRLYATLSQVNQSIVHSQSPEELYKRICNVAVEYGKFRLAWVGLFDQETGIVTPVSVQGIDGNTLPFNDINAYQMPYKEGLIGASLREKQLHYCNDIQSESTMIHWYDAAKKGDYHSAVAVPFRLKGKTIGILNLYAVEKNFFTVEKEQHLLEEISLDISFALDNFSKEEERKKAETLLKVSELKFRTTLDSMLEGCQIIGHDWRYLYLNDAADRHNRRPKEELLGNRYMDMWPGIEETEVFRLIKRCLVERIPHVMENLFVFPDGSRGCFELSIQPVPEGVFILSQDITTRKMAEEAQRKSEDQFRMISENVADMIAVLDLEGKRMYNSPSYKFILGDPHSLQGTDSFQEIHPGDREKIRQIFQETIKTGIGQRAEYRFILKDGSIRFIESNGSVIKDEQGNIARVLVVSRDVTEQRQIEKQFMRMQRMESIGTLAGGIAHDLNNVLSPILLSINIISKQLKDEKSQKLLQMLEASALRGSELIKQVLSFARGVEGERSSVQIRHLIDEIGKIVKETFPKSISFQATISKTLPTICADATRLHQVLMNLCVNARDAMPNGGKLEIKADEILLDEQYVKMHLEAKKGLHVVITVTDQGMGIPPATMERIFEPFFTTKELGKGTGLGLSTVLAIVKSHDGFVNVYSEIGKGTTFKVYFPAQDEMQVNRLEERKALPHGKGELILIVDDEESIREITKTTLLAYGYEVITASDGTEAIAEYAMHSTKVALVITDMMMPFMDGTATIRAIQKLNPLMKFLAVSGLKQEGDIVMQDTVEFLQKPYTSDKLLRTVDEILH